MVILSTLLLDGYAESTFTLHEINNLMENQVIDWFYKAL